MKKKKLRLHYVIQVKTSKGWKNSIFNSSSRPLSPDRSDPEFIFTKLLSRDIDNNYRIVIKARE